MVSRITAILGKSRPPHLERIFSSPQTRNLTLLLTTTTHTIHRALTPPPNPATFQIFSQTPKSQVSRLPLLLDDYRESFGTPPTNLPAVEPPSARPGHAWNEYSLFPTPATNIYAPSNPTTFRIFSQTPKSQVITLLLLLDDYRESFGPHPTNLPAVKPPTPCSPRPDLDVTKSPPVYLARNFI